MSRINSNVASLRALRQIQRNQADLGRHLERLSTGLRINRGRDDPAGLIVSEILRSEIKSTQQAIKNSIRASNVISTTEGALNEVSALLLDLQAFVVATANEAGLSREEVRANQLEVDSILDSIDRIGNTTRFAGEKLLDGSRGYNLSGVTPTSLASVSVFSVLKQPNGSRQVRVQVTQSALTARLNLVGTTVGAPSTTAASTVELRGTLGSQLLSFASGTTLSQVRVAINDVTAATGVSAIVSAASVGAVASALVLTSTTVGNDAFVSIQPFAGNFVTAGNAGIPTRVTGREPTILIDGALAQTDGLRANIRSDVLEAQLNLTTAFAQSLSTTTFTVVDGGAVFQLTPDVNPNGQLYFGFQRISSTSLGNSVAGLLYSIRSGEANDFQGKNFETAQNIVDEAIQQVAFYRGRLGNIQRNHIDPNIQSQTIAAENLISSESVIRDADMAEEVSELSRSQILVQSTQSALQIANSIPSFVLSLLQ